MEGGTHAKSVNDPILVPERAYETEAKTAGNGCHWLYTVMATGYTNSHSVTDFSIAWLHISTSGGRGDVVFGASH
jgi:hypothetical protein